MTEFKVGDKVKVVNYSKYWDGIVGKVVRLPSTYYKYVEIALEQNQVTPYSKVSVDWFRIGGAGFLPVNLELIEKNKDSTESTENHFTPFLASKAINVLISFLKGRHPFTCYDVTLELRKTFKNVFHKDIRTLVYALEADKMLESYSRHTVSFVKNGVAQTAEVFALTRSHADKYDPYRVSGGKPSTQDKSTKQIPSVAKAPDTTSVGTTTVATGKLPQTIGKSIKRDSRGRLCLRKKDIDALRWSRATMVKVYLDNNTLTVTEQLIPKQKYLSTYKVDRYGNIRLGNNLLRKAGITNPIVIKLTDSIRIS